jgi:D-tyrosyl-tRNA(Tyr) deacylase
MENLTNWEGFHGSATKYFSNHFNGGETFVTLARRIVIGLLQRVSHAAVVVEGAEIGAIEKGLLVLVGVERGDGEREADRLLERLLGYRVFPDAAGRMNLSLTDIGGGLLLVPQFTLAADTQKGTRPGFSPAAAPADGERLFDYMVGRARAAHGAVETGKFGADMKVSLTNDGPVTFWLHVPPQGAAPLNSRPRASI